MKHHLTILLLLSFVLAGCKKLPKETQGEENFMAFYLDGEKWLSKPCSFCRKKYDGGNFVRLYDDNQITIRARHEKSETIIQFHIYDFKGEGNYVLNGKTEGWRHNHHANPVFKSVGSFSRNYSTSTGEISYSTDSIHTGCISITHYDTDDWISGTFSFSAKSVITNEEVIIQEGRFDIRY